jgi:hypothetical protein
MFSDVLVPVSLQMEFTDSHRSAENKAYVLIRKCYVHGIIEGEGLSGDCLIEKEA